MIWTIGQGSRNDRAGWVAYWDGDPRVDDPVFSTRREARAHTDEMNAAPKRPSGPGGKNQLTEVKLRAEDDEIDAWTRAAEKSGVDRNSFIRQAANDLAEDVLGESGG